MRQAVAMRALTVAVAIARPATAAPDRSALQRDLVDYAMASCFAAQPDPYLKDQGQRWAGAVMQRAHGPVELWTPVADAVARELGRTGIGGAQPDRPGLPGIPLPVMTCGEITETPSVRMAIETAARALRADYANRPND